MKRSRWSIPALGAFFVAVALVVSACGSSGVPSNSVATVAGNPISTKAFNHWMYVDLKGQSAQSPGTPVIVPDPPNYTKCVASAKAAFPQLKKQKDSQVAQTCKQLFTATSGQVLDFLIKAYWYQGLAHQQGIDITDKQVQQALAKAKKSQFKTAAQFQAFLKQSGYTADDLTYRVRINQVFDKLIKKHPTSVSQQDVAAYYAAHKSQFGTPERRNMRIVLAKTKAQATAAKNALTSGQSWSAVAKKYSQDPTTKNKGGLLTDVTAGQQDQALSKAAFAAKPNKIVGPVKGQFGYYVIDVLKVTSATTRSLPQSQATIKQTLTQQKRQQAQTAIDAAAKKAFQKKTKCKAAYAMTDCNGYKAPKTTPAQTPTPTPTPTQGQTAPTPQSSSSGSSTTP